MSETVVITGGAGYLGSVLSRELLDHGYTVRVVDTCLFGQESIGDLFDEERFSFVEADVTNTAALSSALEGGDRVVHLAAIVGEPACSADPDRAIQTNLQAVIDLKRVCREHGITDVVFLSTCSVYGDSSDELITEVGRTLPLSIYSQTKKLAEESLLQDADELDPTILRLATVYGLSYRPRFDLSINYLTKEIYLNGEGTIFGGDQWRPFVHTTDVARAIRYVIEADGEIVSDEIFNVGSNEENYQMKEVGDILDSVIAGGHVEVDPSMVDDRTYRCSFDKIHEKLGYEPEKTLADGICEIRDALEAGEIEDPDDDRYYNYTPKEE